jgi:hypothetical protein
MLFNILALISLLIVLMMLRMLVEVFPSLMACLIRSKESINLEASVQLSRARDFLALSMFIPFCLIVWRFNLYSPAFLESFNDTTGIGVTIGLFLAYVLSRKALEYIFRPKKSNGKLYNIACKASRTFFGLLTLTLLAMGGIMTFAETAAETTTSAMLWVSAAIYLIFLLRKFQILMSSASFFAAFLYLCALEFIPTGAIIASAIVF